MTNMANVWSEKGWEISLLTFSGGEEKPFYSLHTAVKLYPLALAKPSRNFIEGVQNNFRRIFVLRRAVLATHPDTVISFMDSTNVIALLALMFTGIPVIAAERSNPNLSLWRFLRLSTYPFARNIVFQTERGRSMFPFSLLKKTVVIPNPVYLPSDEATETSLPRPCFIGVGRLSHEKGFDLLIEAFARTAAHSDSWSLVLLGDGPLRSELEKMVKDLGIATRVKFLGNVKNPFPIMKQADIFVLPSRLEGFPNALCEAMACGLPVIAIDCATGPREIIRDGIDGLLVPQGSIDLLAKAMDTLMNNLELRKSFGNKALEVTERFRPERILQLWEGLIP